MSDVENRIEKIIGAPYRPYGIEQMKELVKLARELAAERDAAVADAGQTRAIAKDISDTAKEAVAQIEAERDALQAKLEDAAQREETCARERDAANEKLAWVMELLEPHKPSVYEDGRMVLRAAANPALANLYIAIMEGEA